MADMLQFVLGALFLAAGLVTFLIEIIGIFRLRYVLNRMHAAALGDTLGISLSMIGLMIWSGFGAATLKMALVVIFLWCASPVSSHLIARLEVATNEHLEEHLEILGKQQKETAPMREAESEEVRK